MTSVLHIITTLSTGGAERALYNLLVAGVGRTSNTAVLSLRDDGTYGDRIRALQIPVYVLGIKANVIPLQAVARLRRCVREVRPDVIQGWMYHGNLTASLAAWLAPGCPTVAWNVRQSLYSMKREKPMTRLVIRANRLTSGRADVVVYNGELSRQQHEAFGFASRQARVLPNGFDLERFRPDGEHRNAVREMLGIPRSTLVVGHIARLHPMKDHALFLRAAVRVAGALPRVQFLLAGRNVSLDSEALAGIVPNGMESRFLFLGEREDVSDLMHAMDVFCLSSRWGESFPNVVGEAMATGVPCVVTNVGDSALVVGNSGVVVPPGDQDALAAALMSMLSRPSTDLRVLGQAARARIEAKYALPHLAQAYAQLYENLAGRCRKPLLKYER